MTYLIFSHSIKMRFFLLSMWNPSLLMKLSPVRTEIPLDSALCAFSMMLCLLSFFIYFFTCCLCKSDVPIGFQVMIPIPSVYNMNFTGRAFFLETTTTSVPNFKAALSVEAINGSYSCSLQVFIGDFKVWSSGHFYPFKPTDVMLWGQRISVATRLTSFPTNTNMFYSFEIQYDKIALLLNSGTLRYSYWDFRPTEGRNITFAHLGSTALKLFDGNYRKIAQISVRGKEQPLRFLTLGDITGNLGFHHYSPTKGKFEASFQALNTTCDLPLACGPYGICTHSNSCSCIQFSRQIYAMNPKCNEGFSTEFCRGGDGVEMVEIMGVSNVLRVPPKRVNVTKEECVNLCIEDCKCSAVLYSVSSSAGILRECFHYGMVRGVKQVEQRIGLSYLVKVPKGTLVEGKKKSSKVKKWLLLMGGVVDGLIILVVGGGFAYYFFVVRKRRIDSLRSESNRNS